MVQVSQLFGKSDGFRSLSSLTAFQPVKYWCDVGNIEVQYNTTPSRRSLLDFPSPADLGVFF